MAPGARVCDFRMLSKWTWHWKAGGIIDGRAGCICKGRRKTAEGTRMPQKGRCVSGMEVTRRRHAVFGFVEYLGVLLPYQAIIVTERLLSPRENPNTSVHSLNSNVLEGFVLCRLFMVFLQGPWQPGK
jgi:hypothetical protein